MSVSDGEIAALLNHLIGVDRAAIEAYDEAIEKLENGDARNRLRGFRCDHERHAVELSRLVRDHESEAARRPLRHALPRGKAALEALSGDAAILQAMRHLEDETNERYEKALAQEGLPPEVLECMLRLLSDERLHRAWIEECLARRETSSRR